jgi:hypothetical protein
MGLTRLVKASRFFRFPLDLSLIGEAIPKDVDTEKRIRERMQRWCTTASSPEGAMIHRAPVGDAPVGDGVLTNLVGKLESGSLRRAFSRCPGGRRQEVLMDHERADRHGSDNRLPLLWEVPGNFGTTLASRTIGKLGKSIYTTVSGAFDRPNRVNADFRRAIV